MSLAVPVCDDVVWRVGLDIGYVSYTSRWQCRRARYGVPSLGWTTHPWTRVSTWKSYVLAKQSPDWIVFPDALLSPMLGCYLRPEATLESGRTWRRGGDFHLGEQ
ncbi:unnamed protein product [Prunus armeniaca]